MFMEKDKKIRRIGIPAAASDIVKKYIVHRGISEDKNRHVFSSQIHEKMGKMTVSANSHFLRTAGTYSTDSQEHAPDTNYYAAKGSLHE